MMGLATKERWGAQRHSWKGGQSRRKRPQEWSHVQGCAFPRGRETVQSLLCPDDKGERLRIDSPVDSSDAGLTSSAAVVA